MLVNLHGTIVPVTGAKFLCLTLFHKEGHCWELDIHLSTNLRVNKLVDKIVVLNIDEPNFETLYSTFPHCLMACIMQSKTWGIPTKMDQIASNLSA